MNIITRKPYQITPQTEKTCIAIQSCCGEEAIVTGKTVLRLRKAGSCQHIIEYPAEVEGDSLCFVWDNLIYELQGRYIGDIFEDEQLLSSIQFDVNPSCFVAVKLKEVETEETIPCEPPQCN